jgi:hypothetical protein
MIVTLRGLSFGASREDREITGCKIGRSRVSDPLGDCAVLADGQSTDS